MTSTVTGLRALEILDSRGRPTLAATVTLASGASGRASVPSGASRGAAEAVELRDHDAARYGGLGVRTAVRNVDTTIGAHLRGSRFANQRELDAALVDLDGAADKSRLGANALLSVSLAFARARAREAGLDLYTYFASLAEDAQPRLPRLTVNLFSGGKHAGGQIALQDVLVVPSAAASIDDGLAAVAAVYAAALRLTAERYGSRGLVADEGGLAPQFEHVDAMLQCAVDAIEAAGYAPLRDVALAIDVASSHFYADSRYEIDGDHLDAAAMIERIAGWAARYPIVSVEDGLAEDDWEHWPLLRERLHERGVLTVGDDLLCTNPARIRRAIDTHAADTLLLKVNQIGTLTEAADACALARAAGWLVTVSARSGETEDDWLADLAVGWRGDQIKVGSIARSERLAKYNRLLAIEADVALPLAPWPLE